MKSDDIEELFREAAEKYHIDTEKAAAWNDVHDTVHADDAQPQPPAPAEDKRKKRWLILVWFLLVPFGWFAHYAWNSMHEQQSMKAQQLYANANTQKNLSKENNAKQTIINSAESKQTPLTDNSRAVATVQTEKPPYKNTGSLLSKSTYQLIVQPPQPKTGQDAFTNKFGNELPGSGLPDKLPAAKPDDKAALTNEEQKKNVAANGNAQVTPNSAIEQKNSSPQQELATKNTAKKEHSPPANEHYFYAGLVASPDISFIHFQKTSPAGLGAGILLGYHINKKFSIETGVLIDEKNYYTEGGYFDRSRVPYFANNSNLNIIDVNGDCKMIEIPLNLRYAFKTKGKNTWYATGGFSSYMMGREYYNYDYKDSWNSTTYKSGYAYHSGVKNWFSIVNLGAGYERSLGTKTSLRIEPYIKIPVTGVGTGNLSITSMGLYFGITRRIP